VVRIRGLHSKDKRVSWRGEEDYWQGMGDFLVRRRGISWQGKGNFLARTRESLGEDRASHAKKLGLHGHTTREKKFKDPREKIQGPDRKRLKHSRVKFIFKVWLTIFISWLIIFMSRLYISKAWK
jgi:hypothetical protein